MLIEWDVPIEMDDGLCLRADVFRPLLQDIAVPVILSHGPYAKGLHFEDGYPDEWEVMRERQPDAVTGTTNRYANWEVVDPEKWVPDGYACVRVDSRGAGRSPGFIQPFSPRETRDFYLCIEWAGTQAWSNGKVGLSGISYYAINQWQVAALQPPHLAAICPWEGAADWYRDATHHGGIRSTFWANWWEHQVRSVQFGLGARGPTSRANGMLVCGDETLTDEELARNRTDLAAEIESHPLIDDYYVDRTPDWANVNVPILSAGNWGGHGLHLRGNTEGFVRAASSAKWLELHGLDHWTQYYADSGRLLQKKFFDFFLKGEANGWNEHARVQLSVRHVDGTFEVRFEDDWPILRTRWTTLYLSGEDQRLSTGPVKTEARIAYAAAEAGLTFITDEFDRDTEVTGPAAAKLFVSSSTQDADLFVTLRLFDPSGREVTFQGSLEPASPLGHGWLRASHRALDDALSTAFRPVHTHTGVRPLEVGRIYELDIELWPTCVVIPAGYKLGLAVSGRDYEHGGAAAQLGWCSMNGVGPFKHDDPLDRPPATFDNEVALYTGGSHPSSILLPVVPPV
jgi:predicted acyl esterase